MDSTNFQFDRVEHHHENGLQVDFPEKWIENGYASENDSKVDLPEKWIESGSAGKMD